MSNRALLVDHDICFNCHACFAACAQENNLLSGSYINLVTIGPQMLDGKLVVDYVPVTCAHCAEPACVDACPVKAITKRQDGVVLIDSDLCNGCMACISACPFAAIQFNSEKNVAEKCNLCLHRIDRGLEPACVQHCQAKAILFGDINEVTERLRSERIKRRILRNKVSEN